MLHLNYETKDEFYQLLDSLAYKGYLNKRGNGYIKGKHSEITRLIYVTLTIPITSEELAMQLYGGNNSKLIVSDNYYTLHIPLYNLFDEDILDRSLVFQEFENRNCRILAEKTTVKTKKFNLEDLIVLTNTGREVYVEDNIIYYI